MLIPLNLLEKGKKAIITKIDSNNDINRRLMDMGMSIGSHIECVNVSPLGDPKAFLIKGTVIAIRNTDSKNITVKQEN